MLFVVLQHFFVKLGKSDLSHDYYFFGQTGFDKCVNLALFCDVAWLTLSGETFETD
jgi:hypothetical protein